MAYAVHLAPAAERQLKALDKPAQQRIVRCLRKLKANPRPHGIAKLTGSEHFYRIREGDYRIIYTIKDRDLIILVVKIGHRKDVNRRKLE